MLPLSGGNFPLSSSSWRPYEREEYLRWGKRILQLQKKQVQQKPYDAAFAAEDILLSRRRPISSSEASSKEHPSLHSSDIEITASVEKMRNAAASAAAADAESSFLLDPSQGSSVQLGGAPSSRLISAHARSRMSRPPVALPNPGDSVQFTHHNRFLAGVVKAVRPPGHVQIEYIINTGHRERASRVWVESRQIKGFRAAIDVAKADVHGTVPCLAWTEGSDVRLRRLGRTTFGFMFGFNDSDFMRAMTAMFTGGRK